MRLSRIFTVNPIEVGREVVLEQRASHYVSRVLRLAVGDEVILFNGQGGEYLAKLVQSDGKTVRERIGTNGNGAVEKCSEYTRHLVTVSIARGCFVGVDEGETGDLYGEICRLLVRAKVIHDYYLYAGTDVFRLGARIPRGGKARGEQVQQVEERCPIAVINARG